MESKRVTASNRPAGTADGDIIRLAEMLVGGACAAPLNATARASAAMPSRCLWKLTPPPVVERTRAPAHDRAPAPIARTSLLARLAGQCRRRVHRESRLHAERKMRLDVAM